MKNKSKFNIISLFVVGFGVLMIALGFLLYFGIIRFNYPSLKRYPILGIDISHHQGKIYWNLLNSENIQFVIIKATEGSDFQDRMFNENVDSAKIHGYKVGAYHYYRLCTDYLKQADNFSKAIDHCNLDIPPAVDLEFGDNCQTNKSKQQIISEIKLFLSQIESKYQTKAMLYATSDFYKAFLENDFINNPIWIRDIFCEPKLSDKKGWKLWQFANRGRLNGISTYVDVNTTNIEKWNEIVSAKPKKF